MNTLRNTLLLVMVSPLLVANVAVGNSDTRPAASNRMEDRPSGPQPAINRMPARPLPSGGLRRGNTEAAFALFSELTGLTVLAGSPRPDLPAALIPQMTNSSSAEELLRVELAKRRMELVRKEELFALIVPAGFSNSPAGRWSERLKISPLRDAGQIPLGCIDFRNADLAQVLALYSEWTGRTLLRSSALPTPQLSLQNAKPLTRAESLYALELLLALHGIAVRNDGEKLAEILPIAETERVLGHAPKPRDGDPLIEPAKVPVFTPPIWSRGPRVPSPTSPADGAAAATREARDSACDLAEYYAQLTGRTLLPSRFDHARIFFRLSSSLTRVELLYAIETTFELNSLALVPVDKNSIRIGHLSEKSRPARP